MRSLDFFMDDAYAEESPVMLVVRVDPETGFFSSQLIKHENNLALDSEDVTILKTTGKHDTILDAINELEDHAHMRLTLLR